MQVQKHIRLAGPEHAAIIANLSRYAIERGLPWRWTPQRVTEAIADPQTNVAVALEGEMLVAFGIMKYEDTVAHLLLLAVDLDMRRTGYGSAVLSWLERVASVAGIERIRVEARVGNAPALAFYRKHGYALKAVLPKYYAGREDAVRLQKRLIGIDGGR